MLEYITPDVLAAQVRMLRQTFGGAFLLVEGHTDARLFGRLVDRQSCVVQNCYNKGNVVGVVSRLDDAGFVGHLGIVDSDFGRILAEAFVSQNLIVTDAHDVEMMVFRSAVFDNFLVEYANAGKITAIENEAGKPIRELLLEKMAPVGALRLLSIENGWALKFEEMDLKFVSAKDLDINLKKQIQHLRGRSGGTSMPGDDAVVAEIDRIIGLAHEPYDLVCGHDLCETIARGVRKVFGRAHVALGQGGVAVGEVFRAAYTFADFSLSNLCNEIRAWEARNFPYKVLP